MKKYISYIGSGLFNVILRILFVFPMKKNRVMFISYFGRKYSCNPRYISEYLQEKYPDKFEIIWVFREPEKFDFLQKKGIVICKCRSLKYYFYRITSKVVICNSLVGAETPIRKNQLYIQTWHGSGAYKSNVKARNTFYEKIISNRIRKEFQKHSFVMASCEAGKEKTFKNAMGYHGTYINGMPRMDMLINQDRPELKKKVLNDLNINSNTKMVLYAPTWRNNCKVSDYAIDYSSVKSAFEQKFGGEWVVLRRMHHYSVEGNLKNIKGVIDVTSYPEMQELLYAADAVISDYSSTLWDYSFTGKPCFQYCPDLEEYQKNRGISTNIRDWGFPLALSNEELVENILNYDEQSFIEKMKKHHKMFGALEDGHATEKICNIIAKKCL